MALTKITSNMASLDTLTANNGVLELDDNGTHNGIINVPASLSINIDSDNGATTESFTISKDKTAINDTDVLFRVKENGTVLVGDTASTYENSTRGLVTINGSANAMLEFEVGGTHQGYIYHDGSAMRIWNNDNSPLYFVTNGSERMRIASNGSVYFGVTSDPSGSVGGSGFLTDSAGRMNLFLATTTTGAADIANFHNPNGMVGRIVVTGSSTAYNTSSDYRLKENVVTDWDATTRLKQLKPSRFNFI